jgi:hypothetical protein
MSRVGNASLNPINFNAPRGVMSHKAQRKARQAQERASDLSGSLRKLGQFSTTSLQAATVVKCGKATLVQATAPRSRSGSVVSNASESQALAVPSALHAVLAQARRFFTATVNVASNTASQVVAFFAGVIHNARPSVRRDNAEHAVLTQELDRLAEIEWYGGNAPDAHLVTTMPAPERAPKKKKKKAPVVQTAAESTGPKPVEFTHVKPGKTYANALKTLSYAAVLKRPS